MEWQPIETAPKDNKEGLLLFFPRWGCIRGYWHDDKYASKPKPHWYNDRVRLFGKKETCANQPTHWMPLPDAPSK